MLKFRTVRLTGDFYGSSLFPSVATRERESLQRVIDEIGEENIRYITSSAGAGGGSPTFTIFYHEDDPA